MRTVTCDRTFDASLPDAEARWYDTSGWPAWVDGMERVTGVDHGWPGSGACVRWESGPAGRGAVTERVLAYEPREGQTLEVSDDSIRGRQTIAFSPEPPGVRVTLTLAYEIRRRSPLTPLVDVLFIRRAMAASLERTLSRFGAGLTPARA